MFCSGHTPHSCHPGCVAGKYDRSIGWIGLAGVVALTVAALIEFAYIVFERSGSTGDSQPGSSGSLSQANSVIAEEDELSMEDIEENMTFAGMV